MYESPADVPHFIQVGTPGWGYAASRAARQAAVMQAFPLSDGLWVSDVATGKGRLIVSLAQLREVTTTGDHVHSSTYAVHIGAHFHLMIMQRGSCHHAKRSSVRAQAVKVVVRRTTRIDGAGF